MYIQIIDDIFSYVYRVTMVPQAVTSASTVVQLPGMHSARTLGLSSVDKLSGLNPHACDQPTHFLVYILFRYIDHIPKG